MLDGKRRAERRSKRLYQPSKNNAVSVNNRLATRKRSPTFQSANERGPFSRRGTLNIPDKVLKILQCVFYSVYYTPKQDPSAAASLYFSCFPKKKTCGIPLTLFGTVGGLKAR